MNKCNMNGDDEDVVDDDDNEKYDLKYTRYYDSA
jgi:hypothetical protein